MQNALKLDKIHIARCMSGEIYPIQMDIVQLNCFSVDSNIPQFLLCQFIIISMMWTKASELRDQVHQQEKKYHDQHKSFVSKLSPGDQVLLQNPKTGLWDNQAEVISIRPDGLSYTVKSCLLYTSDAADDLLCVDKWSGFPLFKRLQTQSTKAVTDILESWFNVLGWPSSIRSDGGPQFCGPFRDWCQKNNIKHELSAPYNP